MPDLVVAGAGMAGLVAAAEAASRGADVLLLEKGDSPGGNMALSSGVAWRHNDFAAFRAECPGGDPVLQRLVYERLDEDLAWLEGFGARVLERSTGNPATVGVRLCTKSVTDALARRAGRIRLREPLRELPDGVPVVLATGGFQAGRDLVRSHVTREADCLFLRTTDRSVGDGLRLALAAGARTSAGMDEIYGRNMPAPPARLGERDYVPVAQLYGRHATIRNVNGDSFEVQTWSEIDVVQWTARQPRARATYTVPVARLGERVGTRTVGEMIAGAERAGGVVRQVNGRVEVEVVAGITTTLGGLAVDATARAAEGVYAAGSDVGGIATGGYASGLAAALVLGRIAAASALKAS